eukprot:122133-Hanusia_phi.AAC.1
MSPPPLSPPPPPLLPSPLLPSPPLLPAPPYSEHVELAWGLDAETTVTSSVVAPVAQHFAHSSANNKKAPVGPS